MAPKKSDLYSSLWASCDELRGGMDASKYKDYVLVLREWKNLGCLLRRAKLGPFSKRGGGGVDGQAGGKFGWGEAGPGCWWTTVVRYVEPRPSHRRVTLKSPNTVGCICPSRPSASARLAILRILT